MAYVDSPSLYSQMLQRDLSDIVFSEGSVLILYVDDLMVASPTLDACVKDSITLLIALAEKNHKAS